LSSIVSIITPSYNRADLVRETAASIMAQSYPYWEWMIVDDGSTDNSWEVLQELAATDSRIKIFQRGRRPKGACPCRNIAVENSTGEYVIFLDTDDLLAPFCLEQRVKAIEESDECDFVIFPMLLFQNKWDDLKLLWNIENGKDDLHRILIGDPVCQGTGTIWKKTSFEQVGMWREDLALWQDIELHIRSLLFPMKYIKRLDLQPDIYLRITPNSLSRGGFYSVPKIKSRIIVLSYTCETMEKKGVSDQYKPELKNMALDIAISTILGGQFAETQRVLAIAESFQLFEKKELKNIRNFLFIRRWKLYKIKRLNNHFMRVASEGSLKVEVSLGKMPWKPVDRRETIELSTKPGLIA